MIVTEVKEKGGYSGFKFRWFTYESASEFAEKILTSQNKSEYEVTITVEATESGTENKDGDEQW